MDFHNSRASNARDESHIKLCEERSKLDLGPYLKSISPRNIRHDKRKTRMPSRKTKLVITGMCDEDPPSYAELETDERIRIRREVAFFKVAKDKRSCVHFSSIREIMNSQELENKISRYPEGARTSSTSTKSLPAHSKTPETSGSGRCPLILEKSLLPTRGGPLGHRHPTLPPRRRQPGKPRAGPCSKSTRLW